jgi:S1-C subfamily serine protease
LPVAGVITQNAEADLAVIKVDGKISAQPLELAGNDLPKIGEKVYAIGNPRGFTNTLSDGLVSGHREHNRKTKIQITAPISPGSSGGPLLRADGKVVGVTSAGFTAGAQNINFAVPASEVKWLLLQSEVATNLSRFPLVQQTASVKREAGSEWGTDKEATLVERIKGRLVPGMTSKQAVTVIVQLAKEAHCGVGWSEKQTAPYTFVVRYFPFEGSRGSGRTGLMYRLNVLYVHDRLHDWYIQD